VLINQGAPYIYIMIGKLVPAASKVVSMFGIPVPRELAGI
jgi:hypothetical protein